MVRKSTRVIHEKSDSSGERKKRRVGHDPLLALRMPQELTDQVDEFAKAQDDKPNRSEALRRLVEWALKHSRKGGADKN